MSEANHNVIVLDEKYPNVPTMSKVAVVQKVYKSNRTAEENRTIYNRLFYYFGAFAGIVALSSYISKKSDV